MPTVREQIVAAFAANINATRCVRLNGTTDLPARGVWDTNEEAEKTRFGTFSCTLDLIVNDICVYDDDTYANWSIQANERLGQLIEDVFSPASMTALEGLVSNLTYTSSEVLYPSDGQKEIELYVTFEVEYEYSFGLPSQTV